MRSLITPMSKAAAAAGADGLIIEVHPCPERALSDGPQSLDLPGFQELMESLKPQIYADERRSEIGKRAA
jgi:3-deoxy-7-phosphoheptulonate synthase